MGEVEVGTNSYAIETSVTADTYIIVVACNAQGESEALASVKIQDLTPDSPEQEPEPVDNGGIYFLMPQELLNLLDGHSLIYGRCCHCPSKFVWVDFWNMQFPAKLP